MKIKRIKLSDKEMIKLGLYNIRPSHILMKIFEDQFRFKVKGIQNGLDEYFLPCEYIFYGNYHKLPEIKYE